MHSSAPPNNCGPGMLLSWAQAPSHHLQRGQQHPLWGSPEADEVTQVRVSGGLAQSAPACFVVSFPAPGFGPASYNAILEKNSIVFISTGLLFH